MRRQRAWRSERGADALVMVGRHFGRQIGRIEELVEQVVDALQPLRGAIDEHALRVLRGTVGNRLLLLNGSGAIGLSEFMK